MKIWIVFLLLTLSQIETKRPWGVLFKELRIATAAELPTHASEGIFVEVNQSALEFKFVILDLPSREPVLARLKNKKKNNRFWKGRIDKNKLQTFMITCSEDFCEASIVLTYASYALEELNGE